MTPKTATFRSGRYRICTERIDGYCEAPDAPPERVIYINPDLTGQRALEVAIHEALHAHDRQASEQYVERGARDIARLLWRMGYRRQV